MCDMCETCGMRRRTGGFSVVAMLALLLSLSGVAVLAYWAGSRGLVDGVLPSALERDASAVGVQAGSESAAAPVAGQLGER